jgi:hypothetical protein
MLSNLIRCSLREGRYSQESDNGKQPPQLELGSLRHVIADCQALTFPPEWAILRRDQDGGALAWHDHSLRTLERFDRVEREKTGGR